MNNHKVASDFTVVIPYLRYTNGIVKIFGYAWVLDPPRNTVFSKVFVAYTHARDKNFQRYGGFTTVFFRFHNFIKRVPMMHAKKPLKIRRFHDSFTTRFHHARK